MPLVRLAVVGVRFGTYAASAPGAAGVFASKFRDAPAVDVPQNSSLKEILRAVERLVASGGYPYSSRFAFETDTSTIFIKKITNELRGTPHEPGLYSISDSSDSGVSGEKVKIAFQSYHFDSDFRQKNTDGFKPTQNLDAPLQLDENDILIIRALVIVKSPASFNAPTFPGETFVVA